MRAAVAYCRSAVEAQGTPSSTRRQAAALARYATRHRLKLRGTYIDAGVSGATLERPALRQLLADCRAGKVHTVLIRDPDRLSRNSDHLLLLLAKFQAAGVRLEFTTPAGKKQFEFTKIL
jgi:site-specific DNA recombinase